jgi:LacI family transcriptional regulator
MSTIYDISRRLNISPSTVSRALRPNTQVSAKVRERVKDEAERIGYRPNLIAKQLKVQKSNLLGLLVDEKWNWFSSSIADGVQAAARRLGYSILVWNSVGSTDERAAMELFCAMRAAGVIVASTEMLDDPKPLLGQEIPSVYICRVAEECDTVVPDDYHAATCLAEYLLDLGHRDIAVILGPPNSFHTRARAQAVRDVMRAWGVSLRDDWVIQRQSWRVENGYEVGMKLFGCSERPTAVLSLNDAMAYGVNDAARELGLRVPGDVSIVGHDDHAMAFLMRPRLTTFSLPLNRMGERAVELLVERIGDPDRTVRHDTILGEMLVRDSCAHVGGRSV